MLPVLLLWYWADLKARRAFLNAPEVYAGLPHGAQQHALRPKGFWAQAADLRHIYIAGLGYAVLWPLAGLVSRLAGQLLPSYLQARNDLCHGDCSSTREWLVCPITCAGVALGEMKQSGCVPPWAAAA